MNKRAGFSLMEMMIVLLIVAIVAAASAPMINKKMLSEASSKSPWVWTDGSSIAYNLKNANVSALIGGIKAPNVGTTTEPKKPRLFVNSNGAPQITLGYSGTNTNIVAGSSSIAITNKVDSTAIPSSSTILGYGANYNNLSTDIDTTIIGANAKAGQSGSAVGKDAIASDEAVAVGSGTNASSKAVVVGKGASAYSDSIAIGYGSIGASKSVAIGKDAYTDTVEAISIGHGIEKSKPCAIAIGAYSGNEGSYGIALGYKSDNINGSSSIAIGAEATTETNNNNNGEMGYSIAIGRNATTKDNNTIAIGRSATASAIKAIAIGNEAEASGENAIAIGTGNINASKDYSIAIGCDAEADFKESVAIGHGVKTTAANQIVLGTRDHTVYIPGCLVVGRTVHLATEYPYHVAMRIGVDSDDVPPASSSELRYIKRNSGGDDDGRVRYGNEVTPLIKEEGVNYKSDRRLKNVGKAFVGGLEEIKKLEVFNYTFKKDPAKTPRVGVMAQDLQKIFPDAVMKGEDGFLRIRMEDMFYALVNAVKELAAKFDIVDKRIADLEKQNQELKKQNEDLQKTLKSIEKRLSKLEK